MDSTIQSQLKIQNYIFAATIAVTSFEYFVVWKRGRLASSWLFYASRYAVLFSGISWIRTFLPCATEYFAEWASNITPDVLVFLLTGFKTFSALRGPRFDGVSLSALISRDGAIYVTAACLKLANFLKSLAVSDSLQGYISFMTGVVASIILSRKTINIFKEGKQEHRCLE